MQTIDAGARPVEQPVRPRAPMRAWKVYVKGWGYDPQSLTMATSRSKAIAKNHASANEAGYRLKWSEFRAVRAPDFDAWFEKHGAFSWAWTHVLKMLAA